MSFVYKNRCRLSLYRVGQGDNTCSADIKAHFTCTLTSKFYQIVKSFTSDYKI